jgi:hypothetical protein
VASAPDTPPLPLDRYAHLHAAIDAGELQDKLLEREKVELAIYLAAQAFWLKRMADEAERRQFETTIRYQTLFSVKKKLILGKLARERAARERPPVAGPPVEGLGPMRDTLSAPLASQLGPTTAPSPPAPAPPPLRRPPGPAMPSFLAGQEPPRAPATSVAFGGPSPFPSPPVAPPPVTSPYVAPQPVAPPPLATPPKPEHGHRRNYATMSIDLADLQAAAAKAATPFKRDERPGGERVKPVEPPRGATEVPPARSGQTAQGNAATPAGLPFRDEPSHGDGRDLVAVPAYPNVAGTAPLPDDLVDEARRRAREASRADAPPKASFGATGTIDPEVMARARASLPFAQGALAGAAPVGAEPRRGSSPAIPATVPAAEPPAAASGARESPKTQAFDFNSIPAHLREGLPFASAQGTPKPFPEVGRPPEARREPPAASTPSPPSPPTAATPPTAPKKKRFTINVFASLTAELAENPADVEAIRQRYGVTEAEHHEEARAWTDEFNANDDVRQRYLGIVQRYRGYIQQRKR